MQFSLAIWSVVACLALPAIDAQLLFLGGCPQLQELQQFDLGGFMELSEFATKCNSAELQNEDNLLLSENFLNLNLLNGAFTNKTDFEKFLSPAQLQGENQFNYFLLGTDYDSFAVLYSCTEPFAHAHFKHIWILTRSCNLNQEIFNAVEQILQDNNNFMRFLVQDDQETAQLLQ